MQNNLIVKRTFACMTKVPSNFLRGEKQLEAAPVVRGLTVTQPINAREKVIFSCQVGEDHKPKEIIGQFRDTTVTVYRARA